MARFDKHIDFVGFASDLDPETPGVALVMTNTIPTRRGFAAARAIDQRAHLTTVTGSGVAFGTGGWIPAYDGFSPEGMYGTLFVACQHSTAVSTAYPSGTSDKLIYYKYDGASGVNVSNDRITDMISFGGQFVAAGVNVDPASTATNFGAMYSGGLNMTLTRISGSPIASLLIEADRFVLAFAAGYHPSRSGGYPGVEQDRWICAARDTHTDWALSPTTLCATGRLPDSAGGFVGVSKIGDEVYAFKSDRCYRGRFVAGSDEVWQWELAPFDYGALRDRAVAQYRGGIVFLSQAGLFYYDGANLTNLMDDIVITWWQTNIGRHQSLAYVCVDSIRDIIYCSALSEDGATRYILVCHVISTRTGPQGKWGSVTSTRMRRMFSGPPVIDASTGIGVPIDETRRVPWVVPTGQPVNNITAGNSYELWYPRPLTASATINQLAEIRTNLFGDAFRDSELTGLNLKQILSPVAAFVATLSRNTLSQTAVSSAFITASADGHFHVRQNARYHQLRFNFYGDFEITGFAPELTPTGLR